MLELTKLAIKYLIWRRQGVQGLRRLAGQFPQRRIWPFALPRLPHRSTLGQHPKRVGSPSPRYVANRGRLLRRELLAPKRFQQGSIKVGHGRRDRLTGCNRRRSSKQPVGNRVVFE